LRSAACTGSAIPYSSWISIAVSCSPLRRAAMIAYAIDRMLWLPNAGRTRPALAINRSTQRS
jgi:hypothetical protein